jgi:hypothetical protein
MAATRTTMIPAFALYILVLDAAAGARAKKRRRYRSDQQGYDDSMKGHKACAY